VFDSINFTIHTSIPNQSVSTVFNRPDGIQFSPSITTDANGNSIIPFISPVVGDFTASAQWPDPNGNIQKASLVIKIAQPKVYSLTMISDKTSYNINEEFTIKIHTSEGNQPLFSKFTRSNGDSYSPSIVTDGNGDYLLLVTETKVENFSGQLTWVDPNNTVKTANISIQIVDNNPQPQPDPTPPTPTKSLYHVQCGAFGIKDNADKLATELKSKGYSAYVIQYSSVNK